MVGPNSVDDYAEDKSDWQWAEFSRVGWVVSIVAEQPDMTFGHCLLEKAHPNGVAGQANDSLADEGARIQWRADHNYLTSKRKHVH